MEELSITAQNILNNFLKVGKEKKVLIIKDEENDVVNAFEEACKIEKIMFKTFQITLNRKNSSPIPEALNEMQNADFIIAPTKFSITHCEQTRQVVKEGKKVITLPGITNKIFLKIKDSNFEEIGILNNKIANFMKGKNIVKITTPSGTSIEFSIKNRPWIGTKDLTNGFVANLPEGECFCAPIEDSANGIIQIDYWDIYIKPKDNAWLKVENGKIVEWGDGAKKYVDAINVENGKIIAEFGIGTNKAHKKPIGNILHDEKIYRSCHIAFGGNTSFGGKNKSSVHIDLILMKPKIIVDNNELII